MHGTRGLAFALGLLISANVPLAIGDSRPLSSIGVSFTAGRRLVGRSEQPGVVPGKAWTSAVGPSGTLEGLMDDTGSQTGVSIGWTAAAASDDFNEPTTSVAATNVLYQGGLSGSATKGEVRITLRGVPFARYTLYTYASGDSTNTSTMSISDGATTYFYRGNGQTNARAPALTRSTSTTSSAPTVGQAQYQVFEGLSDPNVTVTAGGSVDGVISNNVFGIQIVSERDAGWGGPTVLQGVLAAAIVAVAAAVGLARRRRA